MSEKSRGPRIIYLPREVREDLRQVREELQKKLGLKLSWGNTVAWLISYYRKEGKDEK